MFAFTVATFTAVWGIAAMPTTDSIIIRHDRGDAEYLAVGGQYPAVGKVGRRMGDGTLIEGLEMVLYGQGGKNYRLGRLRF